MLGQAVGRDQETMARDIHYNFGNTSPGRTIESDYMIE